MKFGQENVCGPRLTVGTTSERQSKTTLLICSTPRCQQTAHCFCLQTPGEELNEYQDSQQVARLCRAQPSSHCSCLRPGCKNGEEGIQLERPDCRWWSNSKTDRPERWGNFCAGSNSHEMLPKVPVNPLMHTDPAYYCRTLQLQCWPLQNKDLGIRGL